MFLQFLQIQILAVIFDSSLSSFYIHLANKSFQWFFEYLLGYVILSILIATIIN